MRQSLMIFSLTVSTLAATGCEMIEPRWPLPEDAPQLGCDGEAPFGAEFCEGQYGLSGALLIMFTPDECGIDRPRLELYGQYRSKQLTDNEWVTFDTTPSFYGDAECNYWITIPNAGPDIDVELEGNLVFTGVTTKRVFCEDSPAGIFGAWIGDEDDGFELDVRAHDDCYLDIDTSDLL